MGGRSWGGESLSGTIQVSGDSPARASAALPLAALEASIMFHVTQRQVSRSPDLLAVSAAAAAVRWSCPPRLGGSGV